MCWLLLSSQGLFSSSYWPDNEKAGSAQEASRGHSLDSGSKLAKGIFHATQRHAQHIKLRGGERGRGSGVQSDGVLSSQVSVMRDGALRSWQLPNTCLPTGRSE